MSGSNITRRDLLKTFAAGTAGTALVAPGALRGGSRAAARAARQEYDGQFVIVSTQEPQQSAPLIAAIEEAHPGIEVEWRFLPSERFVELFTAAEVAGDQIDLVDLNGQDLRRYALGGRLQDLSDIPFKDRFREVALDTYTIQDSLWAVPRGGISGFTFFFNKQALGQVGATEEPETYQDLLDIAPDLRDAGIAPFVHPGQNIYLWPIWQFWAYAQTSDNQAIDKTARTLAGDIKFTDPEHVAALEILYRFAQDGLFTEAVNSLDRDGAFLQFSRGEAAFLYDHSSMIGTYRDGDFPDLDMSLMPPVRAVDDPDVIRQLPGGTGSALSTYVDIASERAELAESVMELMTSDEWVKWLNELNGDAVSCNKDVQASTDPLALEYADECSPNQITYLDWFWPPEITRAFQEQQQGLVAGSTNPEDAAAAIQDVLDELYQDGYEFQV